MGLFSKIFQRNKKQHRVDAAEKTSELLRKCHFEIMEQRQMLDADPVIAGITYLEGDLGQDNTPDFFEVTFEGGSQTTQMTSFVINGDQDQSGGLSDGDMFFDVNDSLPGTGGHHNFKFVADQSHGITEDDILSVKVSDDGLNLEVQLKNFEAGDKLVFSIDVDEVERLKVDKIASGVEFEGSLFQASFQDDHYTFNPLNVNVQTELEGGFIQDQTEGIFYDEYNNILDRGAQLTGQTADLRADNEGGQADRSAGAIDAYELEAKPISISGHVYHDENINCEHDSNEDGIEGVLISLQRLNDSTGKYETVATTKTDANGFYEFGEDLGLKPGTFRLVEVQPDGYLDVGASAGQIDGTNVGTVQDNVEGDQNVIGNIQIPLGGSSGVNYDFKEVLPAKIEGNVYHDRNDNGLMDPGEEGIANVLIQVTRVGAKDSSIADPFAGTEPIFVRTDSSGHYSVDGLPPGIYQITEINNYPGQADPLANFIDGKDTLGRIKTQTLTNGSKVNDRFNGIELCADDHGIEYNFGELKPTSISGYVVVANDDKGPIIRPTDPNHDPIAGVTLRLLDVNDKQVATTTTDANGFYSFEGLAPGAYTVVEVQPDGYFDAGTSAGTVNGITHGTAVENHISKIVLTSGENGVQYNFCEVQPASISGFVQVKHGEEDCVADPTDPDFEPIAGVTIQLFDENNNLVATTTTNAQGFYEFKGLEPGTYSVVQIQPDGYFDAGTHLGKVDGQASGSAGNNRFNTITLESGDRGIQYNFCETEPASISGFVQVKHGEEDCVADPTDPDFEPIAGVTIQLFDENNNLVATTTTNAQGFYEFKGLEPGTYSVVQIQPDGYFDAGTHLGMVDGQASGSAANNRFNQVDLGSGERGIQYNFCEHEPAKISGFVAVDNGTKQERINPRDPNHEGIGGVTIQLFDDQGKLVATTVTNPKGFYQFTDLEPGKYTLVEIQPDGYFDAGTSVGIVDFERVGKAGVNRFTDVVLGSGDAGVQYNFCEALPAAIHGRVWQDGPAFQTEDGNVPENYRSQRDGVYQSSEDTALSGVRVQLYYYVDPNSQDVAPRPVTLGEVQGEFYSHMGTNDPNAPIWVETDANGEYWFRGLQAGNYIVVEIQPDGYIDANDTAGTTTGLAFNSFSEADSAPNFLISTFSTEQLMDSVVNIRVNSGGVSLQNNFTEVRAESIPDDPPPRIPDPPRDTPNPVPPSPPLSPGWGLAGNLPINNVAIIGSSRGGAIDATPVAQSPYTWHLSVVNGGQPRSVEANAQDATWLQAAYLSSHDWTRFDMSEGVWTFGENKADGDVDIAVEMNQFGMFGGIPLAGDFDGDGDDEAVLYKDGYWLIDINGNGQWDKDDLLAKLGTEEDQPVVGDWDGDGKDDIGIYGPIWEGDREAIAAEPGLPDPDNFGRTQPKNIPPKLDDAADGGRVMRLSSHGQSRIDVIDHVFGYGTEEDVAVVGDWNGDGIRTIGVFRQGSWQIDLNGDGKFEYDDAQFTYGRSGDIPVVGDFNGDGIDEVAIFRNGTWIVDVNGNRQIDATDKVFEMGGAGDIPVVGDWNGDGIDDPAIYNYDMNANHFDVR